MWVTDTLLNEGPDIGWGNLITKQKVSGYAVFNFTSIDYCNTTISSDILSHTEPPAPGIYRSGVARLTTICNSNQRLRYRLMSTGLGVNKNSVNIGPGLVSNLLINNKTIPETGITIDINGGVKILFK